MAEQIQCQGCVAAGRKSKWCAGLAGLEHHAVDMWAKHTVGGCIDNLPEPERSHAQDLLAQWAQQEEQAASQKRKRDDPPDDEAEDETRALCVATVRCSVV